MRWITLRVVAEDGVARVEAVLTDEGIGRADGATIARDELDRFRGADRYPYEVSYELDDDGPYVVSKYWGIKCLDDAQSGRFVGYACFLPEDWLNRRVSRFVW